MLGWAGNQERRANLWEMRGVYALYDDLRLVYIGRVYKLDLGQRLQQHTKNNLRDRWNSFSWYGILDVVRKGRNSEGYYRLGSLNKRESAHTDNVIEVLETLAIRIADPEMIRQQAKFMQSRKRAEHFNQINSFEDPLDKTHKRIKHIEKLLIRQAKRLDKILDKVK